MVGRIYHVGLTVSDLDRSMKLGQQSLGLLPAVQALGTEDLKPIVMDALNGASGAASIIAVADAGTHLDIPGVGIVGEGILQDEDAVAHVLALGIFHAGELVGLVHVAVETLDDLAAVGEGNLVGASLAAVPFFRQRMGIYISCNPY